MGSKKTHGKKIRLAAAAKQTKWAPFWVIPKIFGMQRARHVHPSRITRVRKRWRRSKVKA